MHISESVCCMCAYACFVCTPVTSMHSWICANAEACVQVSSAHELRVWACGMFVHMCECMWGAQVGLEDPESPTVSGHLLCSGSGSLSDVSHPTGGEVPLQS